MDKYYAIGDVHGRADLLERALNEIYSREPDGCKIIFIGDYIDRGPENVKALDIVRSGKVGYDFVPLKGNHEDMFVDAYFRRNDWYDYPTAVQIYDSGRLKEFVLWMQDLDLYHIVENNVFAHAGWNPEKLSEHQDKHTLVWQRYGDEYALPGGLHLTHGHTPRQNGPIISGNRTNIDAGAVFYGRLVVGIYEYGKQGPINFFDITS